MKAETPAQRSRVGAVCILVLFVIFFWMGFEQAGGSMSLFADKQTERHIFGWEMPASWFQSINPVLIVCLAPLFARMWLKLNTSKYRMSDPAKLGWGMVVLGSGFIVLYFRAGAGRHHRARSARSGWPSSTRCTRWAS